MARSLSGFRDAEILVRPSTASRNASGSAEGHYNALREQLEEENRAAHDDGSIERAMTEAAAGLTAGRGRIDLLRWTGTVGS